jgi:hypothetical protein
MSTFSKSYSYLGLKFHNSGKLAYSATDISNKAQKAVFKLKHDLPIPLQQDVKLSMKLFDSMVLPVLSYGCELWGFESTKLQSSTDKLHIKYCKEVLGVSKYASNIAVLGELGRYPLKIIFLSRILSFCEHATDPANCNALLKAALYTQVEYATRLPKTSWIGNLKKCLNYSGLGDVWNSVLNMHVTKINVSQFTQRLKDNYQQDWHGKLYDDSRKTQSQKNKLRLYRQFKSNFKFEDYLSMSLPIVDRIHLTRFRISNHKLQIEFGRYSGIPIK